MFAECEGAVNFLAVAKKCTSFRICINANSQIGMGVNGEFCLLAGGNKVDLVRGGNKLPLLEFAF